MKEKSSLNPRKFVKNKFIARETLGSKDSTVEKVLALFMANPCSMAIP